MKFGKITDTRLLDAIDFSLPPEPTESIEFLKSLPKESETKIYIGAPAWGIKEWIGKIYPKKTKMQEYLKYYAQSFNSIELNSSHYRVPEESKIFDWLQQVPDGFMFCPKFSQKISHYSGLVDQKTVNEFVSRIENFGQNLGISFLQLSENFQPKRLNDLNKFLSFLPKDFKVAIELRHQDWFKNDAVFKFLRERKVASVITDVSGRRDILHMQITSDVIVIRFTGNNLHPTDYSRIDEWVQKIKEWSEYGIKEIYFFVHEPDDVNCPEMADYIIKKLQENNLKTSANMNFKEKEEMSLGL